MLIYVPFAAQLGRLARLTAGCTGVGVAVAGAVTMPTSAPGAPPAGRLSDPAAALVPAGVALLLHVLPVTSPTAGRVVRAAAVWLAVAAAVIGAIALTRHPASPWTVAGLACLALGALLARVPIADESDATLPSKSDSMDRSDAIVQSMSDAMLVLDANHRVIDVHRRWRELTGQNASLREGNARLEAALAFKNDLTSMLTHDVAQPISSIASLAELLRADWADLPEDIRLELATKIDKNTQRLIKMMNDLQLLFRLDMGSVTARRAPVPLLEVVQEVTAAAPGEVEIDIAGEPAALADRGHLTAVVQNLLNNAFAYGDPPVRLSARRLPDDDLIELVVQDSGPGIPDELLPQLFDRFMRGAGLGLFIVRHLVDANGGRVRYERAEPRGARLIVTLESAPI